MMSRLSHISEVSTSSMAPMQKALAMNEILTLIFEFLDDISNAKNARVCKRWSEPALNVLWHDIEDVTCLLHSVGFRGFQDRQYYPPLNVWSRFGKNATRVRSLCAQPDRDCKVRYGQLLWKDMSVFCTYQPRTAAPCPNLRTLSWSRDRQYLPVFFNNTVTSFTFCYLHTPNYMSMPDAILAQFITTLMPALSTLRVCVRDTPEQALPFLLALIDGLPWLVSVGLRYGMWHHRLIEALSRLKHLRTISFPYGQDEMQCPHRSWTWISPENPSAETIFVLDPGAFPSLVDASFYLSLQEMESLQRHAHFAASRLTSLIFRSVYDEFLIHVEHFLDAMLKDCYSLERFVLIFYDLHVRSNPPGQDGAAVQDVNDEEQVPGTTAVPPEGESMAFHMCPDLPYVEGMASHHPIPNTSSSPLSMRCLSPLLSLTSLRTLHLAHRMPLQLTDEDAVTIARTLPLLRDLDLNSSPDRLVGHSRITLHALFAVTDARPELLHLALYADVQPAVVCAALDKYHNRRTSISLETLGLGPAPLEEESCTPLALLLTRVLAPHVRVDVVRAGLPERYEASEKTLRVWESVHRMVPIMRSARRDELKMFEGSL